ncbi:hypothetical protein Pan153_06180 [Gimesia panareensis]|uniref:Carbohydrate-binding domain-containing protein n=1 Tax=Gimesia panareensis TaxID=2527978 RepID=A0A518FI22_9PLAN|nr:DUF4838 domain-containing protein [Gimesia panareensis]QDV15999.1 hypothetical protein Pan153_06180 [Gimesia panareensis]
MWKTLLLAVVLWCFAFILESGTAAERFLIRNGQPEAEIVIASPAPRSTRLAAQELQHYLEKISGAKLEIVTEPTGKMPVTILIGTSAQTRQREISAADLKAGAYRIVSGTDWLALLGDDTDFKPIEPWPRNHRDLASGKVQAAWDAITGEHWGYPHSQLYKHYTGPTNLFGTPNEQLVDKVGQVNVWGFDERGSFNAVCGYLRSLGVRWYLPGVLGEIVPRQKTIPLPAIDQTVRPDFSLRTINFRFGVYGRDAALWAMRLGVRQPYGRQAAHGLDHMTHNADTLKNHPEWFALYGGKRDTQPGKRLNQLCYSNEELFQQTVRYVRAQFDHFDMDVVSVMPPDGYTAICQCEHCSGQDTPGRGYRGAFSDYVWEFVNRVAKEVRKTHPDRKISNCAYGTYTLPPEKLDRLEPNVQVIIVGGRRPTSADRESLRQLRSAWSRKTDNPIIIFENYPFTGRGFYLPAFIPHVLGESINETKGNSKGEDIWLTMDFSDKAIGYNHFLIYFTARMYWGGKDQDVDALFNEYCDLFYGPAAPEMREFFLYCEQHWREMEQEADQAARALELFSVAQAKVKPDSVYGRRMALIDQFLNGLRNKSIQLAQKRGPVPVLRLVGDPRGEIKIDGQLDDALWQNCPTASTGSLRELQTGRLPVYGTTIKSRWVGRDLYFAIRCEEEPGTQPRSTTTKNEDQALWYGDAIEILLSTESHSYYQLAINPAGALIDLDRGAEKADWFRWDSQAEVATQAGDGYWTAEVRIPVIQDENDPLHQVIGQRPTVSLPWHINVCRQRIRDNGAEYSAFAPTGTSGFHRPMKFAHFYGGLSHRFEAEPSVTDYLIASRKAEKLLQRRKYAAAQEAFVALAKEQGATDLQKSVALQQAAECARNLKDAAQADSLAGQIPLEAVQKTVSMQNLLAQREYEELIKQFKSENYASWPFWQVGEAAFARGTASARLKQGEAAEADLSTALKYTPDPRRRSHILLLLGENRENNLHDDAAALKAYRQNYEGAGRIGAADQFRSIEGAARILTRQGQYDAALQVLARADLKQLTGYWRHEMLIAQARTLAAAGRKQAAQQACQSVLQDDSASAGHRQAAETELKKLTAP